MKAKTAVVAKKAAKTSNDGTFYCGSLPERLSASDDVQLSHAMAHCDSRPPAGNADMARFRKAPGLGKSLIFTTLWNFFPGVPLSDWSRSAIVAPGGVILRGYTMSLGTILIIILIIALLGGFSGRFGGYGYGFGHGGVGVLGVVLIIVIVLLLTGRI